MKKSIGDFGSIPGYTPGVAVTVLLYSHANMYLKIDCVRGTAAG